MSVSFLLISDILWDILYLKKQQQYLYINCIGFLNILYSNNIYENLQKIHLGKMYFGKNMKKNEEETMVVLRTNSTKWLTVFPLIAENNWDTSIDIKPIDIKNDSIVDFYVTGPIIFILTQKGMIKKLSYQGEVLTNFNLKLPPSIETSSLDVDILKKKILFYVGILTKKDKSKKSVLCINGKSIMEIKIKEKKPEKMDYMNQSYLYQRPNDKKRLLISSQFNGKKLMALDLTNGKCSYIEPFHTESNTTPVFFENYLFSIGRDKLIHRIKLYK